MAEREQIRRRDGKDDEQVATSTPQSTGGEHGEKLKADLDELLDEIDEVLEDNAEEFVRNYIQKGGE